MYNHKVKPYNRYTNGREKRIKAYHLKKNDSHKKRRTKNNQEAITKMMTVMFYLPTVKCNGLNSPTERRRMAGTKEGSKENKTAITVCLQDTHLSIKDIHRLKVKGWQKILHVNGNQRTTGVALFMSSKRDLK